MMSVNLRLGVGVGMRSVCANRIRAKHSFNLCRKFRGGGAIENRAQGKLNTKGVPGPRDQLRAQQGVSTQKEKVVVHSDFLYAQQLRQN
jgi:hypothetical protein